MSNKNSNQDPKKGDARKSTLNDLLSDLVKLQDGFEANGQVGPYNALMSTLARNKAEEAVDTNNKLVKLYHVVNELMARLGADGEVNAHQDEACNVMSALIEIDGGIYDDEFIGG